MRTHRCEPHRPLLAAAIALALASAPVPASAGDSSPPGPSTAGIRSSIDASVRAATTAAPVAPRATTAPGTARGGTLARASSQTDLGSPGFFRTPAGIITLVALGAGVGYALYSTSHDRITSPAR